MSLLRFLAASDCRLLVRQTANKSAIFHTSYLQYFILGFCVGLTQYWRQLVNFLTFFTGNLYRSLRRGKSISSFFIFLREKRPSAYFENLTLRTFNIFRCLFLCTLLTPFLSLQLNGCFYIQYIVRHLSIIAIDKTNLHPKDHRSYFWAYELLLKKSLVHWSYHRQVCFPKFKFIFLCVCDWCNKSKSTEYICLFPRIERLELYHFLQQFSNRRMSKSHLRLVSRNHLYGGVGGGGDR